MVACHIGKADSISCGTYQYLKERSDVFPHCEKAISSERAQSALGSSFKRFGRISYSIALYSMFLEPDTIFK